MTASVTTIQTLVFTVPAAQVAALPLYGSDNADFAAALRSQTPAEDLAGIPVARQQQLQGTATSTPVIYRAASGPVQDPFWETATFSAGTTSKEVDVVTDLSPKAYLPAEKYGTSPDGSCLVDPPVPQQNSITVTPAYGIADRKQPTLPTLQQANPNTLQVLCSKPLSTSVAVGDDSSADIAGAASRLTFSAAKQEGSSARPGWVVDGNLAGSAEDQQESLSALGTSRQEPDPNLDPTAAMQAVVESVAKDVSQPTQTVHHVSAKASATLSASGPDAQPAKHAILAATALVTPAAQNPANTFPIDLLALGSGSAAAKDQASAVNVPSASPFVVGNPATRKQAAAKQEQPAALPALITLSDTEAADLSISPTFRSTYDSVTDTGKLHPRADGSTSDTLSSPQDLSAAAGRTFEVLARGIGHSHQVGDSFTQAMRGQSGVTAPALSHADVLSAVRASQTEEGQQLPSFFSPARRLEIAVNDPSLGTVDVRAELRGGILHASLAGAPEALGSLAPALHRFLQEHRVDVRTVDISARTSPQPPTYKEVGDGQGGMSFKGDGRSSADPQSQAQPRRSQAVRSPMSPPNVSIEAVRDTSAFRYVSRSEMNFVSATAGVNIHI